MSHGSARLFSDKDVDTIRSVHHIVATKPHAVATFYLVFAFGLLPSHCSGKGVPAVSFFAGFQHNQPVGRSPVLQELASHSTDFFVKSLIFGVSVPGLQGLRNKLRVIIVGVTTGERNAAGGKQKTRALRGFLFG